MPKDRFPLYMWMSAVMSVATPFVHAHFGIPAVLALWAASMTLTAVLMLQDRRRPDMVIYPSQVKDVSIATTITKIEPQTWTEPVQLSLIASSIPAPSREESPWMPHDFETPATGSSPSP